MVNTFNSTNYNREQNGKDTVSSPGLKNVNYSKTSQVVVTTGLGLGDLLNFHHLPPGSELVEAILYSDDLDSGGPSITIDVGDADGAATIFSASLVAGVSGVDNAQVRASIGKAYTVETLIQGKVHAAAAAAVAGSIWLTTYFKIKGNPTS